MKQYKQNDTRSQADGYGCIMQVISEGFKPYKSEKVGPGLTWAYLEK